MSLRTRMGLAAGAAVALAVIAVAIAAYAGTRSELRGQVDRSLNSLAQPILQRAATTRPVGISPSQSATARSPSRARQSGLQSFAAPQTGDPDEGLGFDRLPGQAFGGPSGTFTLIHPQGGVYVPTGQKYAVPADARAKRVAASGRGRYLTDMHVGRTHVRVLIIGIGVRGAIAVALPLSGVDHALSSLRLLLALIALGGIALAALLGILVGRTALAPISRFTRQTELIAAHPQRLGREREEESGSDELARLARTFNATLDALERSVQSQRHLVADASHELRTPIATLRANLQLMREESRLTAEDRDALRKDMIQELDELTALVGDVVELARGSEPTGALGEHRLDAIVAAAVKRTRKRAPAVTVKASLEATLVTGNGDRIARAVTNLLDNACQWSSSGGVIEVSLHAGTLNVRDHGPGFHAEDLPFVFDRFHRAHDARSKPGSGLGLAIVRQAADAHGGFVEAHNARGGGALLRVSFGPPIDIALTADGAASLNDAPTPAVDDGVPAPRRAMT